MPMTLPERSTVSLGDRRLSPHPCLRWKQQSPLHRRVCPVRNPVCPQVNLRVCHRRNHRDNPRVLRLPLLACPLVNRVCLRGSLLVFHRHNHLHSRAAHHRVNPVDNRVRNPVLQCKGGCILPCTSPIVLISWTSIKRCAYPLLLALQSGIVMP